MKKITLKKENILEALLKKEKREEEKDIRKKEEISLKIQSPERKNNLIEQQKPIKLEEIEPKIDTPKTEKKQVAYIPSERTVYARTSNQQIQNATRWESPISNNLIQQNALRRDIIPKQEVRRIDRLSEFQQKIHEETIIDSNLSLNKPKTDYYTIR